MTKIRKTANLAQMRSEMNRLREDIDSYIEIAGQEASLADDLSGWCELAGRMAPELLGVVIDVEQGSGFDDACLATIKRVREALIEIGSKSKFLTGGSRGSMG